MSQSLVRHVQRAQTKTVKKLLSLPQVDVNYCDDGKTPIMCVGLDDGVSDEQCCEVYDVLIQAGALNYSKADKLVYVSFCGKCCIEKISHNNDFLQIGNILVYCYISQIKIIRK